jgi:hypothetical protein
MLQIIKMKKILLVVSLLFIVSLSQAQRFFYVESGTEAESLFKENLLKASQFVAEAPLVSEFIIKTEIDFKTNSSAAKLKIILEDTASFKTVFQANEEYSFRAKNLNSEKLVNLALRTLIEKNLHQMIFCAEKNYRNSLIKLVTEKKDKT